MQTELNAAPSLRSYLLTLRRRIWWVIGLAVLGVVISIASLLVTIPQYTSTAQVLIQSGAQPTAFGTSPQPVTQTDVLTELQLVTSAPVAAIARRSLGSRATASATEVGATNVIAISATATRPARAAQIANAYARAFVSYRRSAAIKSLTAAEAALRAQISNLSQQFRALNNNAKSSANAGALLNQEAVLKEQLAQIQVEGVNSTGGAQLVAPAQVPTSPSSPQPVQDGLFGLVGGLIAGIGAVFLRDSLDEALSSKEAIEGCAGVPVLSMVPEIPSWKKRDEALLISRTSPFSQAAETYRSLRASIHFVTQEQDLHVLLVTSPSAATGKTSTVSNLGLTFAQAGERIVLASCDLRRPRLEQYLGVDEQVGLTDVLLGQQPLRRVLHQTQLHENLWVLPCGPVPPNPAELLSGPRMREVLADLRDNFGLVLIDSPPVLPVADAVALAEEADAALLVVSDGRTRRADLHRATERLSQVGCPIIGTVLNNASRSSGYRYEYGYGSGQLEATLSTVTTNGNGNIDRRPS